MSRLLLVDDDRAIREALSLALRRAGHDVVTAATGEEGLARWREGGVDLVLLDWMLPDRDGIEVCRTIRAAGGTPVVMLTARDDPFDVVVGLEVGADDYVTKPVEPRVLAARIKAVLRRAEVSPAARPIELDGLVVDRAAMRVHRDGRELHLTPTELKLLLELLGRPGQVFTRELLLQQVWDYDHLGDSRLVDAAIQRLRSKVERSPAEPTLIRTVRGVGYRLDLPPGSSATLT
ncbi:response regulator transcription factor [Nitriliruptoraceae bacterium ZYF776]|nr:response regulator transcription factor [Profundirhabdus halotolerans]